MTGDDIRRTAEWAAAVLARRADEDWTRGVPDLELSVAEVAAHVAEVCLWYALDLATGPEETSVMHLAASPTAPPGELWRAVLANASLLAAIVDRTPPDHLGFHPLGSADPSGFAAMACDELAIHTDDIARAFDDDVEPPAGIADSVLGRLFPWVEIDDAWPTLRWANGRAALGATPPPTTWAWHCAPLETWDGRPPSRWQPA